MNSESINKSDVGLYFSPSPSSSSCFFFLNYYLGQVLSSIFHLALDIVPVLESTLQWYADL